VVLSLEGKAGIAQLPSTWQWLLGQYTQQYKDNFKSIPGGSFEF